MEYSVEQLLNDKGIAFKVSGKDFVIKCLNPEHEDSNPSCRVDRLTSVAHCFSCGWSKNLFKFYGLEHKLGNSIKIQKLKEKLNSLKITDESEISLEGAIPYSRNFRSISSETLKHFEAFYTTKVPELEDRIVFPIRDISENIVAYLGRHTLSNANPKYKVYPGGRSLPCYPQKISRDCKYIVLVEGIFDMLNLYDKGLKNVIAVFGTQAISADTVHNKLFVYKAQGIQKVYILFDGDTAGVSAAKNLKPIIDEYGLMSEIVSLPNETDPGDLDEDTINQLKRYFDEHCYN